MNQKHNERTVVLQITPSLVTALVRDHEIKFNPSKLNEINNGFCSELSRLSYKAMNPNDSCLKIEGDSTGMYLGYFAGLGYLPFHVAFDEHYDGVVAPSFIEALMATSRNSKEYVDHCTAAYSKLSEANSLVIDGDVVHCDFNTVEETITFNVDNIKIEAGIQKVFGYSLEVVKITDDSDDSFDDFILIGGINPDLESQIENLGQQVSRYCIEDAYEDKTKISKEMLFRIESVLTTTTFNSISQML